MQRFGLLTALVLAAGVTAAAPPAQTPGFHVSRRIPIGGEGGWDALTMDVPSHRLFVTHATRVEVVDVARDTVIGQIPDTPGPHGVALAPDLGRGFTSNGRDSSVTVFDLKSLAILDRVKIPERNPDAIEYDPVTHRVFTFNGGSANATAIDARTGHIVGSVPIGGKPEFAVADGKGVMYVNNEDSSEVVAFDTRTLKVLNRWPLAPGEGPSGIALDREHHRLFSACSNAKLVVLDTGNGRVVSVLPTGQGTDGAAFDSKRGLAFVSNGEGTLTVIQEAAGDRFTVIENAQTQRGARTLAIDESTGIAYVVTAEFGPAPEPTAEHPHPRPRIVPGSFVVLEVRH
jgi:DNA-binding beta-propeller fold protein YncE